MPSLGEAPSVVVALKTRRPRTPRRLVARPRLDAILDGAIVPGDDPPDVVLVTGPAGAGKTTWLSSWARRHSTTAPDPSPTAWVTVDSGDDVRSLRAAVLTACAQAGGLPAGRLLGDALPGRDAAAHELVAALTHQLAGLDRPLWLVLDEVDALEDADALRSLDALLRWTPPRLRLVLVGRREPRLALHRLRVESRLLEVRAQELDLDRAESVELLSGHDLHLEDADIDVVLERTEGWAAGVRLAAICLETASDQRAALFAFAGDDRAVGDYLAGEVLGRLPPEVRDFLVRTSVCDRITPDLADALTDRDDAGLLLEELARANVLTLGLGGKPRWYRYHGLLRSHLAAELARRPPAVRAELHRRAALWAAAHGDHRAAIEHACRCDDPALAVALVRRSGLRLMLDGHGAAVTRTLRDAPAEVRATPTVALVAAAAALDAQDITSADEALALVPPAEIAEREPALSATVSLRRAHLLGDAGRELQVPGRADTGGPADPELDLLATVERATTRLLRGELDAAEPDLRWAAEVAGSAGHDHMTLRALTGLAAVAASRGDSAEMGSRAGTALAFAAERGWDRVPQCAAAHVIAASAAYSRLDLPTARDHIRAAVELTSDVVEPPLRFATELLDAVLSPGHAGDCTARCRRVSRSWPSSRVDLPPVLVAHASLEQQHLALQAGEPALAAEARQQVERRLGVGGEAQYLRAVVQAHRGHPASARQLLAPICQRVIVCVADRTLIQALVLDAVLADATADGFAAHRALTEALAVAEPLQTMRCLTLAGSAVRDLLARNLGRYGRYEAFATRLLTLFPPGAVGAIQQLTGREQEVLVELPSLRTAEQIAAQQFVSVNTVKTHMRGIYRKLGARNRREALEIARTRGLL
ncbi:hypothetical protein IN07_19425 [Modestobacter caceresii]|uniref:HTH luxR-type domain-containing protein n=1 Tax=Modestobacter caceresii TaxID=1522368 RepID=A0A098Y5W1_9ACTN|nr:hypothetical protein IN07_19425 [Modestobacter caceresii]